MIIFIFLSFVFLLLFVVFYHRYEKLSQEYALQTIEVSDLKQKLARGAKIIKEHRYSKVFKADSEIEVVIIEGTPHAFTDAVLPHARNFYQQLVDKKEIRRVL